MIDGLSPDIQRAIHAQIAAGILAGLTPEHRDAVLQRSVEVVLKDWSFKRAVEEAVVAEGRRAAEAMLAQPAWKHEIAEAVRQGAVEFVERLRAAIPGLLIEAFAGTDGSYQRAGKLLEHLRKAGKAE